MIPSGAKPTSKSILPITVKKTNENRILIKKEKEEKREFFILTDILFLDSDVGGGEHNSGVEQMSVSETESEISAKNEEQPNYHEPDDPPETVYAVKEEGEIGSVRTEK